MGVDTEVSSLRLASMLVTPVCWCFLLTLSCESLPLICASIPTPGRLGNTHQKDSAFSIYVFLATFGNSILNHHDHVAVIVWKWPPRVQYHDNSLTLFDCSWIFTSRSSTDLRCEALLQYFGGGFSWSFAAGPWQVSTDSASLGTREPAPGWPDSYWWSSWAGGEGNLYSLCIYIYIYTLIITNSYIYIYIIMHNIWIIWYTIICIYMHR